MASPYSLLIQAINEGRERGDDDSQIADAFFVMLDAGQFQIVPRTPDSAMVTAGQSAGGPITAYSRMLDVAPNFSR